MHQQSAKIVLAGGYPVSEADICPSMDVQKTNATTFYPDNFVAVCAANGITVGKTPTTFDPFGNITRYQVGSVASDCGVSSQGFARLEVFSRWTDGVLRVKSYNGTWGSTLSTGGSAYPLGAPGAYSPGLGRIDVFVRGASNMLWHKWWDGVSWNPAP